MPFTLRADFRCYLRKRKHNLKHKLDHSEQLKRDKGFYDISPCLVVKVGGGGHPSLLPQDFTPSPPSPLFIAPMGIWHWVLRAILHKCHAWGHARARGICRIPECLLWPRRPCSPTQDIILSGKLWIKLSNIQKILLYSCFEFNNVIWLSQVCLDDVRQFLLTTKYQFLFLK